MSRVRRATIYERVLTDARQAHMEHRPEEAVGFTSNTQPAASAILPPSCGNALTAPVFCIEASRAKIDMERYVGWVRATTHPTRPPNRTLARSPRVISAGQRVVPRQDSNLRSRLRRTIDVVIADVFWRPAWAFCSRLVSLVASCVLQLAPRGIPRGVSSLDDLKAFVLGEVGVVLDVERREGSSRMR